MTDNNVNKTRSDEAGESTVDQGRRTAMRKIAIGVGVLAGYSILPEQWTKPIIGQVVLPAHAATSGSTLFDPCSVILTSGDQSSGSVTVLVSGYVIPPTNNVPIAIHAAATGGSSPTVLANVVTNAKGNYSTSITLSGSPGMTSVSIITRATGAAGEARCSVNIPGTTATTSSTFMPTTTLVGTSPP